MNKAIELAYEALIHAKNNEGAKRDSYSKEGKLYDTTTYSWIITAMSHLDNLYVESVKEKEK